MTAYGTVDRAVQMLKMGARDYLTKPFDEDRLLHLVNGLDALTHGPRFIAASPGMAQLQRMAVRVARTDITLLISGETGVGKEVLARFVHDSSAYSEGPFVVANCAAIPGELMESELFGHRKGAFTGASSNRQGWVRAAHGGTLFLDEVGELTPAAQGRLLRVIETRSVVPVGCDKPVAVDLRFLAASNRDLRLEVAAGRFREDLLYRLAAFELCVPPLRERPEDIEALARGFLATLRERIGEAPMDLTPEAHACLAVYAWPGNVRELRNAMDHATVLAGATDVRPEHLPVLVRGLAPKESSLDLRAAVARVEGEQIRRALGVAAGHRVRTAELLGISRKHLWELMKRHDIE